MFTRSKSATEAVALAARQHASAAEQVADTLSAITGAAEEVAETAEMLRAQISVMVLLAGAATLAVLVTAAVVIRAASK